MSATDRQIPAPLELRSFLDRIPTMAWSGLPDGSLDFFNQAFLDYTGLSADQLYGVRWKSTVHLDDLQQLETWWQNLRQSQEAGTKQVRLRRFDGSPRWFLIFANPVRDESGNLVRWYGTNLDVEDRRQAEETLKARELPWRQIVDNIPGLVATMGAKGEVEFLNRQTLEYFGKQTEDLRNWALTDAIHPDDLPRIIEARIKSIEEGRIYDVEHRCRRADGVYRWFQVRGLPVRDTENKITAWYLLLTDIDDRKRAEQKLLQSEADFRTIINNIPGFVHTMNLAGEVEFVNQQILEYFGKTIDECKDWTRAGVVHPDDLPRVVETVRKSIEAGQICDVELRCRRADGVYRWFQSRGRPVWNAEAQITDWYFLLTDIDDRKRAEQSLKRSEAFLAEGQRLSRTGSFFWCVETDEITWSDQLYRIFEFDESLPVTLERLGSRVHPDDAPLMQDMIERARSAAIDFEYQHRLLMPDQSIKHIHLFAHATRDKNGRLEYVGAAQDVTDLLTITDAIPIGISVLAPDGTTLYVNRLARDRIGVSLDESTGTGQVEGTCHPDDRDRILDERRTGLSKGVPFELEMRLLPIATSYGIQSTGYRWHLCQYNPLKDVSGSVIRWYVTATDIDDRKRAEQDLERTQFYLSEGQRLSHMGSWAFSDSGFDYWSPELFEVHGLDPSGKPPTVEEYLNLVHPADREFIQQGIQNMLVDHRGFDFTKRIVRPDGQTRHVRWVGVPLAGDEGFEGFVGTAMDVTEQVQLVRELRQSEQDLRTMTDAIRHSVVVLAPGGAVLYANRVALDLTGLTLDEVKNTDFSRVYHPDEADYVREERRTRLLAGIPFDMEMRLLFKSGQYRWQLIKYNPLKDESGKIIRWYATATDIDDRKHAEEKLRQSEQELRTITDTIRQPIVVLAPDGALLYANRAALANSGLTMSDVKDMGYLARTWHPDDVDRALAERNAGLSKGLPFDSEMRLFFKNGQYRWQLVQYDPLKDDRGQIIRWYATVTDIDDRKKTEERLHNENVVLREEIDRSSMFEEIVGSSKPMSQLLKQVEKVAASDSTVLILGETGTGKELIARALHRRSKRASRAFVKVNCAAIPQSLIASELFGHEKGAFTGALQRRVGRFEAANGGTLFLDEIGELPMETQIALLRVLQEKEFERVGSNHPISVDVRLIAATNRDLPAAVAAGAFRQDLFYRLNVFPIAVPPLRERTEDIPLLVEYFVGRFAKEAGKHIRHISQQTLEQLQSCRWSGNIRELQNVVERAVILCETDTFVVDESWLESESQESSQREGLSALEDREVEMIEAALAETHGRISGPSGAAAKLGIPRQTLESKIRRLGIDKYGEKRPTSK